MNLDELEAEAETSLQNKLLKTNKKKLSLRLRFRLRFRGKNI